MRYIIAVSITGQSVNSSNVQQQRLNAERERTKCLQQQIERFSL